jgi:hypothetical protein
VLPGYRLYLLVTRDQHRGMLLPSSGGRTRASAALLIRRCRKEFLGWDRKELAARIRRKTGRTKSMDRIVLVGGFRSFAGISSPRSAHGTQYQWVGKSHEEPGLTNRYLLSNHLRNCCGWQVLRVFEDESCTRVP